MVKRFKDWLIVMTGFLISLGVLFGLYSIYFGKPEYYYEIAYWVGAFGLLMGVTFLMFWLVEEKKEEDEQE